MSSMPIDKTKIPELIAVVIAIAAIIAGSIFAIAKWDGGPGSATPKQPPGATIKITEASGQVHWTSDIAFNETQTCVIFAEVPAGTHEVVCGNFKMEGVKNAKAPTKTT